jgi:hypothetical protein
MLRHSRRWSTGPLSSSRRVSPILTLFLVAKRPLLGHLDEIDKASCCLPTSTSSKVQETVEHSEGLNQRRAAITVVLQTHQLMNDTSLRRVYPASRENCQNLLTMCSLSPRRSRWCILCLSLGCSRLSPATFTSQPWVRSQRPVRFSCFLPESNKSQDFNVSLSLVSLTTTIYMIVQGLAPSFWGPLSDTKGRRITFIGKSRAPSMLYQALTLTQVLLLFTF